MGPRWLVAAGCVSGTIDEIGQSILTGCMLSTYLAKALLHPALKRVNEEFPEAPTKEWVDDLSQIVAHATGRQAAKVAIRSAAILIDAFTADGLVISEKSRILPRGCPYAEVTAKAIRQAGVNVQVARSQEDLGVETTAGRYRPAKGFARRAKKARQSAMRAKSIVKAHRRLGPRLAKGIVDAQQKYGSTILGMSPTQAKTARNTLAIALSRDGCGSCRVTTVAWHLGSRSDPWVGAVRGLLRQWTSLWECLGKASREALIKSWPRLLCKFKDARQYGKSWASAKGIASAVIATAYELGWSVPMPHKFSCGKDGSFFCDISDGGAACAALVEAATQAAIDRIWKDAASSFAGKGLEQGPPDVTVARQVQRWLGRKGYHLEAKLVLTVISGGCWPAARHTEGGRCDRCGGTETPWHRYYSCPANDKHANDILHNKEWMIREAGAAVMLECLWYRGLQPSSLWYREVRNLPVTEEDQIRFGSGLSAPQNWDTSHTDGTGGSGKIPHGIRRGAAVALFAQMKEDPDTVASVTGWYAVASHVPGRQTSQRAEIQALLLRLEEKGNESIPWGTDSLSTLGGVRAAGEARWARCAGINGDLWERVYDVLDEAEEQLRGHHCYSHLGPNQVGSMREGAKTIVAADWLCNGLTDHLADKAAEILQPSRLDVIRYAGYERRAFTVLRRLAFIEADCLRSAPEQVQLAPVEYVIPCGVAAHAADICDGVVTRGHRLYGDGVWVRCKVCCKRRACSF
jgi:hypothetical protein